MSTLIDVLVPSPPQIIESKQSSNNLDTNNMQKEFKVGSPCHAIYFRPYRDQKSRWIPAIITKKLGFKSVNVCVSSKGPTWH